MRLAVPPWGQYATCGHLPRQGHIGMAGQNGIVLSQHARLWHLGDLSSNLAFCVVTGLDVNPLSLSSLPWKMGIEA